MLISYKQCVLEIGKKPTGILHIGAHLGEEFEDYKANDVEYIVWVEANDSLLPSLKQKTKDEGIIQHYVNAALSDKDNETVQFNITNNGQSSSILDFGTHSNHYPDISIIEKRSVQTCRMDSLCKNNPNIDLGKVQFVNLDIQGAELLALQGFGDLLKEYSNITAIYSEINLEQLYVNAPIVYEIDSYLFKFGFKRRLTHVVEQQWGDALYVR